MRAPFCSDLAAGSFGPAHANHPPGPAHAPHPARGFLVGLAASLLVGLLVPAAAIAQDEDDEEASYTREGWYLQASGLFVSEQWASSLSDIGAEDTWGIDFRVGHRFSPWAAGEIELEILGDFFPDERQDLSAVHAAVNTKIYPAGERLERIQPFAIVGLGIVSTVVEHRDRTTDLRQSNADWGFRGGAGIDFYYTENVALSAEGAYVWTVGDVEDIDHVSVSLGILYRF